MALLLKCGAIFLHIPKTGGTWVTQALMEQGLVRCSFGDKHADMVRVLHPLTFTPIGRTRLRTFAKRLLSLPRRRAVVRSDFRFCFVRHPTAWYESYWKWQRTGAPYHGRWNVWGDEADPVRRWHALAALNYVRDEDFNGFVRRAVARRPGFVSELFGWYTQAGIGFVGKQESLADDLVRVLRRLNVAFDENRLRATPPCNVGRGAPAPIVWDTDLRRQVERLEFAALVRYGYQLASRPGGNGTDSWCKSVDASGSGETRPRSRHAGRGQRTTDADSRF
jgi:hypothetical protein